MLCTMLLGITIRLLVPTLMLRLQTLMLGRPSSILRMATWLLRPERLSHTPMSIRTPRLQMVVHGCVLLLGHRRVLRHHRARHHLLVPLHHLARHLLVRHHPLGHHRVLRLRLPERYRELFCTCSSQRSSSWIHRDFRLRILFDLLLGHLYRVGQILRTIRLTGHL